MAASQLPTELPVPSPAAVEATPIERRVQARMEILGGLDWLAVGAGSVWVRQDTGAVIRIDPDGASELASIEVAAAVEVRKIFDHGTIPVAFDHAWVLIDDASQLVGIADDAVDVTIDVGTRCTDLAAERW